jgi:type IV secretory pathway VirB2 component (pilin)
MTSETGIFPHRSVRGIFNHDHLAATLPATAAACTIIASPALAQVAGGVDPQSALQSLLTYGMGAAGAAISIICLFKGGHAVAEGRHLLPYIGGAVGGIILAFGGGFLLQHIGVG